MTLLEAMDVRHSVRSYLEQPIPENVRRNLDAMIEDCNREADLSITVRYDDEAGFDSRLAHYGSFRNVKNYIVLAGKRERDFDFRCGYYGEKIVLYAQQLGLNTCWAALTFNKRMVKRILRNGESLCMVIALGYGETQGKTRKSKRPDEVAEIGPDCPEWFRQGVEAALKAPTAMNQQKFRFSLSGNDPEIRIRGIGPYSGVDLGIAAYHFETASGVHLSQP